MAAMASAPVANLPVDSSGGSHRSGLLERLRRAGQATRSTGSRTTAAA
jgi:hypothetical protein